LLVVDERGTWPPVSRRAAGVTSASIFKVHEVNQEDGSQEEGFTTHIPRGGELHAKIVGIGEIFLEESAVDPWMILLRSGW
jgi:hypothetical protein